jgi:hypothetical protein
MKVKLSLAAALLLVCPLVLGQDNQQPAADPAMEAMIKAGTPGAPHKALEPFVGSWTIKSTFWPAPGVPPVQSEGSAESKWVMGGRYVEERFKGDVFGMPFEGLGYTGYDNVKKQYWSTWMDSMSTSMMLSTGTNDGKAWAFQGTMADPLTGKDSHVRVKLTVHDADHHTMEMSGPGPDGKDFKMMEMAYTRKK